jgi:hypothetical protein
MAKLSAHGRELVRMTREQVVTDGSVSWRRRTVCLMSDGRLMSKDDARFKATEPYDPPEGRFYSWGWKRGNKSALSPEEFKQALGAKGFVEVQAR